MELNALIGAMIAFLAINILLVKWRKRDELLQSANRPRNSSTRVNISVAKIATDLFPITKDLEMSNTVIKVVGGDGEYLSLKNASKLIDGLEDWIKRGADIEYYLVCPSDSGLDKFKKIKKKFGSKFNTYYTVCIDGEEPNAPKGFEDFETFHPTLFFSKGEPLAMWIENDHPRNSMFASDVTYTSPNAIKSSFEIEQFKNLAERIKNLKLISQPLN